ncbi:hypothetical protein GW750_08100 [bacterium]|nr:hypothetical protein [bacterium]
MNNKDIVLQVFRKLAPYRPIVDQYIPLIQISTELELQQIVIVLKNQIHTIFDKKLQDKISSTFVYLQHLNKKEEEDRILEKQELDNLLLSIDA